MPDNNYINELRKKQNDSTQIFDLHDKRIEDLDSAVENQVLAIDKDKNIKAIDVPLDIQNGSGIIVQKSDGTFEISINSEYEKLITDDERKKLEAIEENAEVNKIDTINDVGGNPIEIINKSITLNKEQIGLSNVDNTSDMDKPISTLVQEALDSKITNEKFSQHTSDYSNPHQVNKKQIGLGNVDNTSDMDKPISTLVKEALKGKLDKTGGEISGNVSLLSSSTVTVGKSPTEDNEVANKAYVDQQVQQSSSGQFIIVNVLPDVSEAKRGAIYLVPKENEENIYEKWAVTENESGELNWTDLGSTDIDLSGYIQKPQNPTVNQVLTFSETGKWEAKDSGLELKDGKIKQALSDVTNDVKVALGVDNLNYVKYDTGSQNLSDEQQFNAQNNIGVKTIVSNEPPKITTVGQIGQKWVYVVDNDVNDTYTIEYTCISIDKSDTSNIKYIWKTPIIGLHAENHTLIGIGMTADLDTHTLRIVGRNYLE